jgi:hypothetical protein
MMEHDQQAQVVSFFITDMLAASIGQRRYDGRNAVSVTVLPPLERRYSRPGNVSEQFRRRSRAGPQGSAPSARS